MTDIDKRIAGERAAMTNSNYSGLGHVAKELLPDSPNRGNIDKRIDSILRSFNIDRPDIKELWSTGRFGTIAVPADRYKQYYDTIKHLQAQVVELKKELANK